MIAIAVLAPVFAAWACLYDFSSAMQDFYGPRGVLALSHQIAEEMFAGREDLQRSRFAAAETRYRSALKLDEELRATRARHGWQVDYQPGDILVGLADALIGQRRRQEAVDALRQGAILERQMGHVERAIDLTARADAIRADMGRLAR
jgi:hypothetical protein